MIQNKTELLGNLISKFRLVKDTRTIVFVHSDLLMPKEDQIDEEVLLAVSGYLNQHSAESPCLVTNPIQLDEVLQQIQSYNEQIKASTVSSLDSSPQNIQLVALGHYCAGLEAFNAYRFVNTIVQDDYVDDFEDHKYFANILNRYEFITKFRALGCVTAKFKETPDYSETNLSDEQGHPSKISQSGKPDIETTVRTHGDVTKVLDESSLLYQIALNLSRSSSICLKGEVQPMFPTESGKIVAAHSIAVMRDDVALVDPIKLARMYQEISEESTIYPKSISFMWPRESETWSRAGVFFQSRNSRKKDREDALLNTGLEVCAPK